MTSNAGAGSSLRGLQIARSHSTSGYTMPPSSTEARGFPARTAAAPRRDAELAEEIEVLVDVGEVVALVVVLESGEGEPLTRRLLRRSARGCVAGRVENERGDNDQPGCARPHRVDRTVQTGCLT